MTPTSKRRIAREWIIFLAAITLGLLITYGVFYLGQNTTWDYYQRGSEKRIPEDQRWLVLEQVDKSFDSPYPPSRIERGYHRSFSKPKNPGDLFNDLWPIRRYHEWDEQALKLWLCILSPYLGFCFLRLVLWSVNTLRRH